MRIARKWAGAEEMGAGGEGAGRHGLRVVCAVGEAIVYCLFWKEAFGCQEVFLKSDADRRIKGNDCTKRACRWGSWTKYWRDSEESGWRGGGAGRGVAPKGAGELLELWGGVVSTRFQVGRKDARGVGRGAGWWASLRSLCLVYVYTRRCAFRERGGCRCGPCFAGSSGGGVVVTGRKGEERD